MNLITILSKNDIQNVHAPLPLVAHVAFCIIATVVYFIQFKRKKTNYYKYMIIAFNLTLLTQFFTSTLAIVSVAIAEIILIIMAFVSQWNYKRQQEMAAERKKQLAEMEKGEEDAKMIFKPKKRVEDKPSRFGRK